MLDAKADRKRLGLDVHAARAEHFECIARAVADCEYDMVCGNELAVRQRHAANMPVLDVYIGHLALEPDLAAERMNRVAHVFHHTHQPERADVGFAHVQDFCGCASLDELCQHLAAEKARILDLAVELAIGKGPGAAFAELNIRFGIQRGLAPQTDRVFGALAYRLPALEYQRTKSHLREYETREQAARAGPDHHRPRHQFRRYFSYCPIIHGGRVRDMPLVLQAVLHRCLIGDFDVNGVYEYDRGAPARIDAAAENGVIHQFVRVDAKASDDALTERILGVLERQLDFGESEHGCWLERLALETDARGREHPRAHGG